MLTVEYVGSLDLIFHSAQGVRVTLGSVSFIPGLKVNLLSLHTIQIKERVILDNKGVHLMGGRLTFPQDRAGCRLNATRRLPAPFPPDFSPFLPMHGAPALTIMKPSSPPAPLVPVPAVMQSVRTPALPAPSPSPGVMVALDPAVAVNPSVEALPPFIPSAQTRWRQ